MFQSSIMAIHQNAIHTDNQHIPGLPSADVTPTSGSRPVYHSYQDSIVEQVIFKIMLAAAATGRGRAGRQKKRVRARATTTLYAFIRPQPAAAAPAAPLHRCTAAPLHRCTHCTHHSNPHASITDSDHVRSVVGAFHMYLLSTCTYSLVSITS
jgi:hypothetical protein